MKKEKIIAFRPPDDLKEWLESVENKTDTVTKALRLFSESDIGTLEDLAHKLGLRPGMLIKVAIHYFDNLSTREKRNKIADFLEYLNELEEKRK